ncbi:TPA: hypothetical protein DDW69_04570 [candidate division CPR2 bacterium]|uniref:General secretion pathway protein G n=1 Tax=candidate division CPR2 bacterium GW2011_GWC1_41_48 TaxID=1618344 RepID=A0A0G0Z8F2_UNCC2|nr:MAG: hypothetical protein UT47_C0002G0208 [candidate division CPR2 bacterium GW2011_GWC2_39_35]KKR29066.1 MAG: hypothetical protein UT60_C0007G0011 [candidate division CPR2 bacterium GW2011_GWD2_39_7]KKS09318.1 MAG: hypothetical protein UU65_C0002G0096 [candidate division CPR2 bacterium GW2011_GWC1_41_48]OGB70554.1 MAG: hypothetical protein A2Y26_04405 [candidate division CPR2 bacterium GWD2_39_7]HBG82074.1 hypothetical protein [candidate division CPR2 bacterium]
MKKFKKIRGGGARGFTLIELLVVMAIIAILVTLMIWAINNARMQQRNTQRRNVVQTIKTSLESYYSSKKAYPDTADDSVTGFSLIDPDGGAAAYLKGYVKDAPIAQLQDPSGEETRICYESNIGAKYSLVMLPEPMDATENCPELWGTDRPLTAANDLPDYEDFSQY